MNNTKRRVLEIGACLNQQYRIQEVLGEGGFGITYHAIDTISNRDVAIKEYFPCELATRNYADLDSNLHIFAGDHALSFEKGMQRFLEEGALLQGLPYLSGIVKTLQCFQENNTAYIVMEYIEGLSLKEYISQNGRLSYEEMLRLFLPVMQSMIALHRQGIIHRDISPDNLMLGLDNQMHLIDFGAARQIYGDTQNTMTVILKNGYAPPEQYISSGTQGAWTDVYALSATIYMSLCGIAPPESIKRLQSECLVDLPVLVPDINPKVWHTLKRGLAIPVADRYRSVEQLYQSLLSVDSLSEEMTQYQPFISKKLTQKLTVSYQRNTKIKLMSLILLAGLMLFGLLFAITNSNVHNSHLGIPITIIKPSLGAKFETLLSASTTYHMQNLMTKNQKQTTKINTQPNETEQDNNLSTTQNNTTVEQQNSNRPLQTQDKNTISQTEQSKKNTHDTNNKNTTTSKKDTTESNYNFTIEDEDDETIYPGDYK